MLDSFSKMFWLFLIKYFSNKLFSEKHFPSVDNKYITTEKYNLTTKKWDC